MIRLRARTWRWLVAIGAAVVVIAAAAAWLIGLVSAPHEVGYFAPIFAPDGRTVFAIVREVRATVIGFGAEFFTTPADVRLLRDRFSLIAIRVSDAHVTEIEVFPPSPLEGGRIKAYHGAIFGVPHAHLRLADGDHLEYEIAVTRHDTPLARTFVVRKRWSPQSQAYVTSPPWQEISSGMSGDEPQQLFADSEVVAVPGDELMPCAIALVHRNGTATPLVETAACRRKYPTGIPAAVAATISRRAEIERSETIRTTYAALVARGRASGSSEGQAMLDANREMQRLGFYPKTPILVAEAAPCDAGKQLFAISDAEFTFGLFPDVEAALQHPGTEVDKSTGDYITHRDYTTSRQINEYLQTGHSVFYIRARGACWQMTIRRPSADRHAGNDARDPA